MMKDTGKRFGLVAGSMIAGAALTLAVQSGFDIDPSANAFEKANVPPPDAWTFDSANAMVLEDLGPIDWAKLESGGNQNSESELFRGDNVVVVWDSAPAKIILDTPFSYDEFVVVLKGTLILTDSAGTAKTYKPGDMFMVPKGFTGTWEMTEDFRELIVVDTDAYYAE